MRSLASTLALCALLLVSACGAVDDGGRRSPLADTPLANTPTPGGTASAAVIVWLAVLEG